MYSNLVSKLLLPKSQDFYVNHPRRFILRSVASIVIDMFLTLGAIYIMVVLYNHKGGLRFDSFFLLAIAIFSAHHGISVYRKLLKFLAR